MLLRQGLPFRGHDETVDSLNRGNFLEFLEWHCTEKEIKKGPGNCQLTSPKVQKELVIDIISQDCFSETNTELLTCIVFLDPRNSFSDFNHAKLLRLTQFYPNDFSLMDQELLGTQFNNFIFDVRRDKNISELKNIGELAIKMVKTRRHTAYPLVYRLIELTLVLPIATATVERVFSAMKIVNSDLPNHMGDEWLNNSIMAYIEKAIFATVDNESVLQRYQHMQTRRIQLSSISSSSKDITTST
nr:PREDICTED: uncharacterized protein LOC108194679 [Daucus carota subsp. sativus]